MSGDGRDSEGTAGVVHVAGDTHARTPFLAVLFVFALLPSAGHGSLKTWGPPAEVERIPSPCAVDTASILPVSHFLVHDANEVGVIVYNYGELGFFEFPRGSGLSYGYARPMVGCVRGLDTLVSHREGEWNSFANVRERSARPRHPAYDSDARADQEFYFTMSDTMVRGSRMDPIDLRRHKPIGIEVSVCTRVWSGGFTNRFLLAEYWIKNISGFPISEAFFGVKVGSYVLYGPGYPIFNSSWYGDPSDDMVGYVSAAPGQFPGTYDPLGLAWNADNDGDPILGSDFLSVSARGALGVRILHPRDRTTSFNWWSGLYSPDKVFDWGPCLRRNCVQYAGSRGEPIGDRGHYRMLGNGEVDYDQVLTALDMSAEGWDYPPPDPWAEVISGGFNTAYMLGVGPFPTISSGDSFSVVLAFALGENIHRDPKNYIRNFNPYNPQPYLSNLDFSDLIKNARWADWVFDNPGVDTDGNGYRGEAHLVNCVDGRCDSVFWKGDGVPDWRGPGPPYPPEFDLTSQPAAITLRWSGEFSELQRDPLSGRRDFEGYRVYTGRFDRDDQYSLVASWDIEDYKRFAFDPEGNRWVQVSHPFTIPQWREMLGDAAFDPREYAVPSLIEAYRDTVTDTVRNTAGAIIRVVTRERHSYWEREDYNRGNEYFENDVWVRNAIQRVAVRDTVVGEDTLRYGLYEVTIGNLNPAVPLFFAVTAFDYGNYEVGLEPLESSPSNNSEYAHPIYSTDVVVDSGLRVSVYPNPYKSVYDGPSGERTTYYREGYEGRGIRKFEEQDRRIWFVNLPERATIRIYSLDGDLIRAIHHPDPFLTKYPSAVGWDLVSRNVQAVTSGIYIWRVDSELGTQMGKLVIIK